jgi:hypothetical protein
LELDAPTIALSRQGYEMINVCLFLHHYLSQVFHSHQILVSLKPIDTLL